MSGLIVTTQHLFSVPRHSTRPGHCRGGARDFFRAHGLDWQDFVRNGIAAEQLEATGDAVALELVAWARSYEAQEASSDGR
ncbi:MAG: hypothetical protein DI597_00740 [Pseudoxanthomonas spadix]|nr:MAG: hypothetical protein DI597_00740 [Pseudoxanthomonas spadix]